MLSWISNIIKLIWISIFIYSIYWIFWDLLNSWIINIVEKINNLGCLVPYQIVRLLLFMFITIIVKMIYNLIK